MPLEWRYESGRVPGVTPSSLVPLVNPTVLRHTTHQVRVLLMAYLFGASVHHLRALAACPTLSRTIQHSAPI